MNTLKKCPFCGSNAELKELEIDYGNDSPPETALKVIYGIRCISDICSSFIGYFADKEIVIENWNKRVKEDI